MLRNTVIYTQKKIHTHDLRMNLLYTQLNVRGVKFVKCQLQFGEKSLARPIMLTNLEGISSLIR